MSDTPWLRHAQRLLKLTPAPGVDPADLALALAECSPRILGKGDVLCSEGSDGDAMFILVEGTMSVRGKDPGTGREREFVKVGAPSLAGHMALIDGSKRSATCVAVDGLRVGVLTRAQVQRLLEEGSPRGRAFRRLLITTLAMQLSGANRRIAHLAAPVEESTAEQEASDTAEVMRIAGMLEGWTGDLAELDEVEWVPQVHRKDRKGPPKR